jgi:hypothetical protein
MSDGQINVELLSQLTADFKHGNANENEAVVEIEALVRRVENLYDEIDTELTKSSQTQSNEGYNHIEMLSREIEELCQQIDIMPTTSVPELKAKITLNLTLMSKSSLDEAAIIYHSDKILEALEEFKQSNVSRAILRTG